MPPQWPGVDSSAADPGTMGPMDTVVARITRDVLTVRGPEAVAWLQGQLSQDVEALAVGATSWTFVLAPKGKVDGWGRISRVADDAVQIDVDPGAGAAWVARLERFKLRTKAEVVLEHDVSAVAVRGSIVDGGLAAGWSEDAGSDHLHAGDDEVTARVAAGAVEVGPAELEARRIRAGMPAWGREIDDSTIPATLGQHVIGASVSFTKGCYTGQELVARIDSRGGNVPRRLAGVVLDGPAPAPGSELTVDGAAVGTVTSSAPDTVTGGSVALAFVARSVDLPARGDVAGRPAGLASLPMPAPALDQP